MAAELSDDDLVLRIALYEELREARRERDTMAALLPTEPPPGLRATWDGGAYGETNSNAVTAVLVARWGSLRIAALAGVAKRVAEAEDAVIRFERGEEV